MSAAEALPQEDTTVRGRVNPQSQLAEWEAMKAAQHHEEDDDTSNDDTLPMERILDTEWHCDEFRRELGEPVHEHAPIDDYDLDDLVAMHDYAVCPLHLSPWYPHAPEGVWKRQYHLASVALDKLTKKHTGESAEGRVRFACPEDGCAESDHDYVDPPELLARFAATTAELRAVWDEFPHARWAFEAEAEDGYLTIEIVEE